jgi:hypothetical protein
LVFEVAEFDFDAARRWARFDPQRTLTRRSDNELPFVNPGSIGGQGLLLDTSVYIDQMQGRSPKILDDLIAQRQVNHSTVAIQELMHTVGALNPSDAQTTTVIDVIGKQIRAMPPHRILRRTPRFSDVLRCCRGYSAASKATERTASCAHSRTACCSFKRKNSAWLS